MVTLEPSFGTSQEWIDYCRDMEEISHYLLRKSIENEWEGKTLKTPTYYQGQPSFEILYAYLKTDQQHLAQPSRTQGQAHTVEQLHNALRSIARVEKDADDARQCIAALI